MLLLLLLLGRFSCVQLCATSEMAAHQAPPSLGFSRQEHWSRLPFPSPMHESEKWKWSHSVASNSQRPHGLQPTRPLHPWTVQPKVLEWVAIAFSRKLCYHNPNSSLFLSAIYSAVLLYLCKKCFQIIFLFFPFLLHPLLSLIWISFLYLSSTMVFNQVKITLLSNVLPSSWGWLFL